MEHTDGTYRWNIQMEHTDGAYRWSCLLYTSPLLALRLRKAHPVPSESCPLTRQTSPKSVSYTHLPDEGMWIDLNGCELAILPAHFLHSPGNFHVYDPLSKILYTGDIGASLGCEYRRVEDFDDHVAFMVGFHERYMACLLYTSRCV